MVRPTPADLLMAFTEGDSMRFGSTIAAFALYESAPAFWGAVLDALYEDRPDERAALMHRAEQMTAAAKEALDG